ncbi:DUF6705 family protein [Flavobacterium ponti]|uniref:DUF6705 family protein n=1 Tax=Flavobacterium ponti TaxID=665133 RepID=A0ABV9P6I1_9FLAO
MKKIIILFILHGFVCKAQTPIYPIRENRPSSKAVNNSYSKDTFNDFDMFTGTWVHTDGNNEFKITFQKKLMFYNDVTKMYEDKLVGEYIYKVNGTEEVNTMSNLNCADPYNNNITSERVMLDNNSYPLCPSCDDFNDFRIRFYFTQPGREYIFTSLAAKHYQVNNIEYLDVFIWTRTSMTTDPNDPKYLSVPVFTYLTFVKE